MDDVTKAMLALCSIYDDPSQGFDVEREMVEVIMEELEYDASVIALALEAWDHDHCPNYNA